MMEFMNGFAHAFASNPSTMSFETIKIFVMMLVFIVAFVKVFDR